MTDLEFVAEVKRLRSNTTAMREFLKQPGHLDRLFDLAIKAGSKRPPRHKARTQLPDGFPDQPLKDAAKGFWATRKRMDLVGDIESQVEQFRDHHFGKGTLAADWPATWRTWMRNALKYNAGKAHTEYQGQRETAEVWRWRVKTFHQGDQEQGIRPGYWKADWGPEPGQAGCRAPN